MARAMAVLCAWIRPLLARRSGKIEVCAGSAPWRRPGGVHRQWQAAAQPLQRRAEPPGAVCPQAIHRHRHLFHRVPGAVRQALERGDGVPLVGRHVGHHAVDVARRRGGGVRHERHLPVTAPASISRRPSAASRSTTSNTTSGLPLTGSRQPQPLSCSVTAWARWSIMWGCASAAPCLSARVSCRVRAVLGSGPCLCTSPAKRANSAQSSRRTPAAAAPRGWALCLNPCKPSCLP